MVATRGSKNKDVAARNEETAAAPVQHPPQTETRVVLTSNKRSSPIRSPLKAKDLSSFPLPDDEDDDQAVNPPAMQEMEARPGGKAQKTTHWLPSSLLIKVNLFLAALLTLAFLSLVPILPNSLPPFCNSILPSLNGHMSPSLRQDAIKWCGSFESQLCSYYSEVLSSAKRVGPWLDSSIKAVAIKAGSRIKRAKIVVPFILSKDGKHVMLDEAPELFKDQVASILTLIESSFWPKSTLPYSTTWIGEAVLGAVAGPSYDPHVWEATASDSFGKQKPLVVLLSCSNSTSCASDLAQQVHDLAKKIETPQSKHNKICNSSCVYLFNGKKVGSGGNAGPELQVTLSTFLHQHCPASPSSSPLVILSDIDKVQSLRAIQVLNNVLSESGGLTFNSDTIKSTGSIFVFTISTTTAKGKESDPKAILAARLYAQLKPKPYAPPPDADPGEDEVEEGRKEHEREKERLKSVINGLRRRIDLSN